MPAPKLDPQLLQKALEWEQLREWWLSQHGRDTSDVRSLIDRYFFRIQLAESNGEGEWK